MGKILLLLIVLMGRVVAGFDEESASRFIQTPEDRQNLEWIRSLYEKNQRHLSSNDSDFRIPPVFHVIWLGPREFPSWDRMKKWCEAHPGWKMKFWTDLDRDVPVGVEKKLVDQFSFPSKDRYYQSENYGEKSELLRYEILFQEGGVYIDHDTVCVQSLQNLNRGFDFYCGLVVPDVSILSSSIFPSSHLIGSKPNHPILAYALAWVNERWDWIGKCYPGSDALACLNRVKHRTFTALEKGIKAKAGDRDVVFPSRFFSDSNLKKAIFATHLQKGTWYREDSPFEVKTKKSLQELALSGSSSVDLMWMLATLHVAAIILALLWRKRKVYSIS